MLSIGRTRPNIPEYPMIAEDIRQAIEQIYNGTEEPKQALGEASNKIRQSTRMVKAIRSDFFPYLETISSSHRSITGEI